MQKTHLLTAFFCGMVFFNAYSQATISLENGITLLLENGQVISGIDHIAPAFQVKEMFNEMMPMMMEADEMEQINGKWVKKEKCPSPNLENKLTKTRITCCLQLEQFKTLPIPSTNVELKKEVYLFLKNDKFGAFDMKTGTLLEPKYDNIQIVELDGDAFYIATSNDSQILVSTGGKVLMKKLASIKPYISLSNQLLFLSKNHKGKTILINSNGKTLTNSKDEIKALKYEAGEIPALVGLSFKSNSGFDFLSLSGKTTRLGAESLSSVYDCTSDSFLFSLKTNGKYGLINGDGQFIVKPMSERRIEPLPGSRYRVRINGEEQIIKG